MDKEYEAKLLYKYLKRQGALQRYFGNLFGQRGFLLDEGNIDMKNVLKIMMYYHNNISFSFMWSVTKEGHDYWKKLNDEFYFYKQNYC